MKKGAIIISNVDWSVKKNMPNYAVKDTWATCDKETKKSGIFGSDGHKGGQESRQDEGFWEIKKKWMDTQAQTQIILVEEAQPSWIDFAFKSLEIGQWICCGCPFCLSYDGHTATGCVCGCHEFQKYDWSESGFIAIPGRDCPFWEREWGKEGRERGRREWEAEQEKERKKLERKRRERNIWSYFDQNYPLDPKLYSSMATFSTKFRQLGNSRRAQDIFNNFLFLHKILQERIPQEIDNTNGHKRNQRKRDHRKHNRRG